MLKLKKRTALRFILSMILLVGGFLFVQTVFAQDFGVDVVGENIALAAEDPRIVAARIVRVALGFLGIIAVSIVLYGGFMWMTSAGNEERLSKAKKVLTSGLIGLVIILSAFGITQYVLNRLTEAAGGGGAGEGGGGGGGGGGLPSDAFLVRSIQPNGAIPIRNVVVRVLFNRSVNIDSLRAAGNFVVRSDGVQVAGTINADGNLAEFIPDAACPEPNETRKCFDADTEFIVELTAGIRSTNGKSLMCGGLAPSCSGVFTTGNLVDVTGPEVDITYPDDGQSVSADAIIGIEAHATDDAGISYLDYFVNGDLLERDAPEGPTVRDYLSAIDWDTTGIASGSRYQLSSTAFDIDSNNTISDSVEVIVRAAHCFSEDAEGNPLQDVDETGPNCGGADCGRCDGGACVRDDECRSGICLDGVCRSLPTITRIAPGDGAVGNYITIFGEHFGDVPGIVNFQDNVRANFPRGCEAGDVWQDGQIIVEVPEGAVDGPISVVVPPPEGGLAADYTDRTDDLRGPTFPSDVFSVNETRRPGICAVNPREGEPRAEVEILGTQFGEPQGDSLVNFGGTRAERVLAWGNAAVRATVPLIAPATVPVQAIVAGENSNPVNFTVIRSAVTPNILSFSPVTGPESEYITILGSNFGDIPGRVDFVAPDGTTHLVATDFPEICGVNWWKNNAVVIKIPREATVDLPGPRYTLKLTTSGGLVDDTSDLTPSTLEVISGAAKPGICRVNPDNGPAGLEVAIDGERLGTRGVLNFWRNKAALTSLWEDAQIVGQVPVGAETGSVNVSVGENLSNSINFAVRDCRDARTPCSGEGEECCRDGSCRASGECMEAPGSGHYFWRFSTGEIPINPRVVEYCGSATEPGRLNPSPSPWNRREGGNNICINAQITARFNVKMNNDSLTALGNIIVEECTGSDVENPCLETRRVDGEVRPLVVDGTLLPMGDGFADSFEFVLPAGVFLSQNSFFRVTLTGGSAADPGLTSAAGLLLDGDKDGEEGGDYVFEFKTRDTDELCRVGSIGIMPPVATLTEQWTEEELEGSKLEYTGLCYAEGDVCLTLNCERYAWNWSSSDPLRGLLLEDGALEIKARVRAISETDPEMPVIITGEIPAERKSGTGNLTINFTDPKVIEKWPDCREACKNSEIGVKFNTWMDEEVARNPDNIKLYIWRCGNSVIDVGEDCDDGNLVSGDGCNSVCLNEGTGLCAGFDPALREVSTEASCCGNGRRDPGEDCDGNPFPANCRVGGAGNNCLNEGRLGIGALGGSCGNGTIEEGEDCDPPNLLPPAGSRGCSAECLNQGTDGLSPRGGMEGVLPRYSSVLVSEGKWEHKLIFNSPDFLANTWYRAVISGAERSASGVGLTELNYDDSGDGTVDSYSWAFRTKSDDSVCAVDRTEVSPKEATVKVVGAEVDFRSMLFSAPDECSPNGQKLRAMSYPWLWNSSVEAVGTLPDPLFDRFPGCGNGVLEFGEDCDDGNILSGDGCTGPGGDRACLNEGEGSCVYGAQENCNLDKRCLWAGGGCVKKTVCGNRAVEIGEDCDDGNTRSGDGCNNKCLNEGSIAGGSRCGDMTVGTGEDCDDGNSLSPGCSNICLNEGTVLDGRRDPLQTVTARGLRADHIGEDTTEISATTDGKASAGNFTLACGYSLPGNPCPVDATGIVEYGIGNNSCCYEKPVVETCNPSGAVTCSNKPEGEAVCRNSLISITFDQEMDPGSLEGNIIVAGNYAVCPVGMADIGRSAGESGNWCAVTGEITVNQIIVEDERKTKVDFNLLKLLDPDVKYKVIVRGNNLETTDRVEGVRSVSGVELGDINFFFKEGGVYYQSRRWTFWTNDEICALSSVKIIPSEYLFTSTDENNINFTAVAQDERDNPISSIAGVYAWEWGWHSSNTDIATLNECAVRSGACKNVVAQNKNGESLVSARATIIADTVMRPGTSGQSKTGVSNVIVFLCENPWPTAATIRDDGGYLDHNYNFKFYYCRDKGEFGFDDDLPVFSPAEDVIRRIPPAGLMSGIVDDLLGEYLLTFPEANYCSVSQTLCDPATSDTCPLGTGDCRPASDAIGIRIYENADHLTPTEWYGKQGLAAGSPEEISVDGYEAVRDGRTVYISAANDYNPPPGTDPHIYTNIYIVSYSEGANSDTINIYNQILQNLRFNTNLADVNLRACSNRVCSNNSSVTCGEDRDCRGEADTTSTCLPLISCTKDIDCPGNDNECQAPKDKLARDVRRIVDLNNIKKAIDSYRTVHGTYPKLEAGTYIRSIVASVWGSWSGQLGSELGTALPVDPINKMVNCGAAGFDKDTCWNLESKQYQCPSGSHIYQYKINGDGTYKLKSDFEYRANEALGSLRTLWEKDLSSAFDIQGTCNEDVVSSTGVCGDRIINGDEECEIGVPLAIDEEACAIRVCERVDGTEVSVVGDCPAGSAEDVARRRGGVQRYECNPADCTRRTLGSCSVLCGDGVVQAPEKCDEGPLGGRIAGGGASPTDQYFCTRECAMTGGYCGDKTQQSAYGERCDDGYCNLKNECDAPGGCQCPAVGSRICTVQYKKKSCGNNGTYGRDILSINPWCKTDCSGFGPYCGDEVVNGAEECDGNSITSKGVCVPASVVSDPPIDGTVVSGAYLPCENNDGCSEGICNGGTRSGESCGRPANCPGGVCIGSLRCVLCENTSEGYTQSRTKNCNESGVSGCHWQTWGACEKAGTCGNGTKEGTEECDDGNDNNSDGCISGSPGSNNCKIARCGDGYTKIGTEACDVGASNGVACTARYGETCNYCDVNCAIKVVTGPRCGDGVKNGSETCDGRAGTRLLYKIITDEKYFVDNNGVSLGVIVPESMDSVCDEGRVESDPPGVGSCPKQPDSGDLEPDRAMCLADCTSTCPPSYRIQTLTFGPEGRSSIELGSGVSTTVNLPSCRILGDLKVDVDLSDVEQIPLNVVFVTDRSGSMNWGDSDWSAANLTCNGRSRQSRMDCAKSSLTSAVNLLIDSYENIHIGLVSYGTEASGSSDFFGWTERSTLISEISAYEAYVINAPDSHTNIAAGIKKAKEMLTREMLTGRLSKNVIILMSDGVATEPGLASDGVATGSGDVEEGAYPTCPTETGRGTNFSVCVTDIEATNAKNATMDLYTILFYGPSDPNGAMGDMQRWASEPSAPYFNQAGVDLTAIYRSIIDSLTASTVSLNGVSTGGIRGGADIPILRDIECQGGEQSNIPFSIEFSGTGSARVSNLKAYTCSGPPWPSP